jgi:hypothetical protein
MVFTVLIAISAGSGKVHAQSFGIKLLGDSAATVSSSAGVVLISGWTNVATATFSSGTIRSSDGLVSATLTRSGPGRTNIWHSGAAIKPTRGLQALANELSCNFQKRNSVFDQNRKLCGGPDQGNQRQKWVNVDLSL